MIEANKLLPIGSVVLLKNGTKAVMITGFYPVTNNQPNTVYDYSGCLYPEGMVSSEQNLVFYHNDIAKLLFVGYNSEQEKEFKQKLDVAIKNAEKDSEEGI